MKNFEAGSQARETVVANIEEIATNMWFHPYFGYLRYYNGDNEAIIDLDCCEVMVSKNNSVIWTMNLDCCEEEISRKLKEAVKKVNWLAQEDERLEQREAAKEEMNRFFDEAWYQRACALACQVLLDNDIQFSVNAHEGIVRWKNETEHTTYQVWVEYPGDGGMNTMITGKEDGSEYVYDFSWSVSTDVEVTEAVLASLR